MAIHAQHREPSHRRDATLRTNMLIYLVLIVLSSLFLAPFAWLLVTALKSYGELAVYPIRWWPVVAQWNNFALAVTLIPFLQSTGVSLFLSTTYGLLVTFTSALVGFAFARLPGRGKKILFVTMISTIMLPQTLTLIPTYVLFARFGMIDTYWPWILWGLASAPYMSFLFRQFFLAIPVELEQAAVIDGCGYFRIFWQIFLPLSVPVLVTVFVLSFTATWGDWFAPSLFLSQDNTTLAVTMANGYTDAHNDIFTNVLSAGSILFVAPVLGLFFFAQRFYVRSIVSGSLK